MGLGMDYLVRRNWGDLVEPETPPSAEDSPKL
jgi:hypothetical protein